MLTPSKCLEELTRSMRVTLPVQRHSAVGLPVISLGISNLTWIIAPSRGGVSVSKYAPHSDTLTDSTFCSGAWDFHARIYSGILRRKRCARRLSESFIENLRSPGKRSMRSEVLQFETYDPSRKSFFIFSMQFGVCATT